MEHWEALGKGVKVLVNGRHGFGTDTLFLADFSMPRPGQRCADIGSGCGAVPLLWCARGRPGSVTAVELQEEAAGMLARSAEENGFSDRLTVVRGDARDYKFLLPHQGLDLMACNPPYFPAGTGAPGSDPARVLARHDDTLTLADLAGAARFALKTGGRLCFCLPAQRLAEAVVIFHQHGLEPKRMRMVQLDGGRAPYLFLMECRRGGKLGLEVGPALLLRERDGGDSPELRRIYGDYLDGKA